MYIKPQQVTSSNNGCLLEFAINSQSEEETLLQHYPELLQVFDKSIVHGFANNYKTKQAMALESIDFLYPYQASVGGRYFVLKTPYILNQKSQNSLIGQVLVDFAALHILSEQVRYHPNDWCKVIDGDENAIIGLIEVYIGVVMRRFPNAILNALFCEEFTFGSPARLQ